MFVSKGFDYFSYREQHTFVCLADRFSAAFSFDSFSLETFFFLLPISCPCCPLDGLRRRGLEEVGFGADLTFLLEILDVLLNDTDEGIIC